MTRGGIKPQPKKVQVILALNPPNNVKELRHFLGMVQYYRDMWAKHSEMLAPLSDLVGECGEMKTTRKNKVKKGDGCSERVVVDRRSVQRRWQPQQKR